MLGPQCTWTSSSDNSATDPKNRQHRLAGFACSPLHDSIDCGEHAFAL
jgi:hypothetical protein